MKSLWSKEEKTKLIELVNKFPGQWDKISEIMKNRTSQSCEAMFRRLDKSIFDVKEQIQVEWDDSKTNELLEWIFIICKEKVGNVSDGLKWFSQDAIVEKLDNLKYHLSSLLRFGKTFTQDTTQISKVETKSEEKARKNGAPLNQKLKSELSISEKAQVKQTKNKGIDQGQAKCKKEELKSCLSKSQITEEQNNNKPDLWLKRSYHFSQISTDSQKLNLNQPNTTEKAQLNSKLIQPVITGDIKVASRPTKRRDEKAKQKANESNQSPEIKSIISVGKAKVNKDELKSQVHEVSTNDSPDSDGWTPSEKKDLFTLHSSLGSNWKEISKSYKTKTLNQIVEKFYNEMRKKAEYIYFNFDSLNSVSKVNRRLYIKNSQKASKEILDRFIELVYKDYGIGCQMNSLNMPCEIKQNNKNATEQLHSSISQDQHTDKEIKEKKVDEAMKFIDMLSNIDWKPWDQLPDEPKNANWSKSKKKRAKQKSNKEIWSDLEADKITNGGSNIK